MNFPYPLPPALRPRDPIIVSWWTPAEAAAELGVKVKTVRHWCRYGRKRPEPLPVYWWRVRRVATRYGVGILIASCCVRAEKEQAECECGGAPEETR